tara:strand:- start:89 stop:844 length:756 start_codon:yes stop_codon:yes gene_type:complete
MIDTRVITLLTMRNGRLVKSINFKNHKYIGDPINSVKIFNDKKCDEICLLDISHNESNINYEILKKISKESFLPISYGGNIRDIKDAKKLINIGFEKLCFGFGSYNKILFNEISKEIGRQSITLIIDLKKNHLNEYIIHTKNGKYDTNLKFTEFLNQISDFEIGQLVIQSIDNDGLRTGFDLNILKIMCNFKLDIPIIICGGITFDKTILNILNLYKPINLMISSDFIYFKNSFSVLLNYPINKNKILNES